MAKTLKVLLALVLAATLVFCTVACGGKEEKIEKVEAPKVDGTAKEAVTGFMDALLHLQLVDAATCTEDSEAFLEAIFGGASEMGIDMDMLADVNGVDDVVDLVVTMMKDEMGLELGEEFNDGIVDVVDAILGSIDYEVEEVEAGEEEAKFNVTIIVPDFETAFEDVSAAAEEKLMSKVMELAESGKITEDMTEEEVMAEAIPAVMDTLVEVIEEAVEGAETMEETVEMTAVKKDGKWVLSLED